MTLRYAHDIRSEAEYFGEIPLMQLPPQMVSLADHIVAAKLGDFDPTLLEDRYRTALVPILREKKAQVPARARPKAPSSKTVVNLMDVLKRSLQVERQSSHEAPARRAVAAASKSASAKRSDVRKRRGAKLT
jgi:DNA end-binding protein Ku